MSFLVKTFHGILKKTALSIFLTITVKFVGGESNNFMRRISTFHLRVQNFVLHSRVVKMTDCDGERVGGVVRLRDGF